MTILLFEGGDSVEREVSLESAAYTKEILTQMGHTVLSAEVLSGGIFQYEGARLSVVPGSGIYAEGKKLDADIAFPMIHGHGGEDGILQALLEAAGIPYISEDTATSAIGMHKALQKDIFRANGIKTAPSLLLETGIAYTDEDMEKIISYLGEDLVIKPEAGGSSVGVCIIRQATYADIRKALEKVALYDTKALAEKYIENARELEAGVLKDELSGSVLAMGPVEVVTESSFLDYGSKYSSLSSVIPEEELDISKKLKDDILSAAIRAFESVSGSMYMRVDFLVAGNDFFLNEINTIPGMTEHSHFPVLSGGKKGLMLLFDILINNALRRFEREKELKRSI